MVTENNFTFIQRKATIGVQAAAALFIAFTGMGVCKLMELQPATEYFAALVGIIFYTLFNTIISIAHESFFKYTVPSFYMYAGLLVVLLLSSKFISGISIWDLYEYRNMVISISLFYFIISTLVRAVRFIYEMAESGF